jgi:cytochrome P450
MSTSIDVLTADDALYEELYDVRREAMDMGNLVEEDMNPAMCALRDKGAVQKGFLRDLLGLPPHHRNVAAKNLEGYTCFDWETCNIAFRQPERFDSRVYHADPTTKEPTLGLLEMDGAVHRGYRMTLQPMFIKPKTLTWWRERWINEITETLMQNLAARGDRAELNLQLCARVPVHTVTRGIGMDGDDSMVFRHALIRSSSSNATMEDRIEAHKTVGRMLHELIAKRRREPGDDVISGLIDATLEIPGEEPRPLTDREIEILCRLVMIAGGGTSWRQFGITLWALMTNPEQYEAVKADRSLIDQAIEESVRWNPTDPVFIRQVVEDTELGGVFLPKDAALEICLGAANRDPARWDNPDAYDLFRKQQGHIGFGIGPHQCLGMNVARSEINVGINALLDYFPNMRLDPDQPAPYLTGGLEQRGMSAIPVLLK